VSTYDGRIQADISFELFAGIDGHALTPDLRQKLFPHTLVPVRMSYRL